jgi:uncharacterized membrane protein
MEGQDATPLSPPEDEDEKGLGLRFALKLAAIIALVGVAVWIGVLLFVRAWYSWGFFGAFLIVALALLAWAWYYDRRHPHPRL